MPTDAEVSASERESYEATIRALEAALREARAENDVNHGWVYCPMCGSCGIGGCCGYFCDVCRDRHDGETQDGSPPRDLGDLRLAQGGWRLLVDAAERRASRLRSRLARVLRFIAPHYGSGVWTRRHPTPNPRRTP